MAVVVIVVVRASRVIIIVGCDHATILHGGWTAVAWIIIRIIAIPHIDSLAVCARITPGGCSIINLHLPADRGRGGLLPTCRFQALVLFADIAPTGGVLFDRTRTSPRTNAAPSSTTSAAATAFSGLGGAPGPLHWATGTGVLSPSAATSRRRSRFTTSSNSSSRIFLPSSITSISSFPFPHAAGRPIILAFWFSPVPCTRTVGGPITTSPTTGANRALPPISGLAFCHVTVPAR